MTGYSETELGEQLDISRGMIAQYKAGNWDASSSSKKKKHIIKLEEIKREILDMENASQKGNINEIIDEQNKKIEKLELDVSLLKSILMEMQKS